jgi:hypothetical protein
MRGILGISVVDASGRERGFFHPHDTVEAATYAENASKNHGWAIMDIDYCDGSSVSRSYTKGKKD